MSYNPKYVIRLEHVDIMNLFKNNDTLFHYLIANPYSNQFNANYSGALTEDFFNAYFLVRTKFFDKEIDDLYSKLIAPNLEGSNIEIIGYSHSGKTTFLHSLKNKVDASDNARLEIIDFSGANYTDEESGIKATKKVIGSYLAKHFCRDDNLNSYMCNISKSFSSLVNDDMDNYINKLSIYSEKEGLYNFLIHKQFSWQFKDVINKLLELEMSELITLLSIIAVYMSKQIDKNIVFAFDGLDNLSTNGVQQIYSSLSYTVRGDISRLIRELKFVDDDNYFYSHISFILVMRDVTSLLVSSEEGADSNNRMVLFDINKVITSKAIKNEIAPQSEIIKQRLQVVLSNKDHFPAIKDEALKLYELLNSDVIIKHLDFFQLFDFDYIKVVRLFCEILKTFDFKEDSTWKYLLTRIKFLKKDGFKQMKDNLKFGLRSYTLRLIYDEFKAKKYFESIGANSKISIARIIISYCKQKSKSPVSEFVPFYDIYKDLASNDVLSDDSIIDCVIKMFNLRQEGLWNHLIIIEKAGTNDEQILREKLRQCINAQGKPGNDIRIKITDAGFMFADKITTHFEYFACRYKSNYKPLVDKSNLEKINGEYKFQELILSIIEQVIKCIRRCIDNDMKILTIKKISSWQEYRDKYCIDGKTHPEKIIFSQISYIDAFRVCAVDYMLNNKNHIEAYEIQKCLADLIYKYANIVNLFITGDKEKGITKVGDAYFSDKLKQYVIDIRNRIDMLKKDIRKDNILNKFKNLSEFVIETR